MLEVQLLQSSSSPPRPRLSQFQVCFRPVQSTLGRPRHDRPRPGRSRAARQSSPVPLPLPSSSPFPAQQFSKANSPIISLSEFSLFVFPTSQETDLKGGVNEGVRECCGRAAERWFEESARVGPNARVHPTPHKALSTLSQISQRTLTNF